MKDLLVSTLLILCLGTLFGQNNLISGKVSDAGTKEALPFVHISVKGTSVGTISNIEGEFDIDIPSKYKTDTLVFSCIGYTTEKLKVSEWQGYQDVALQPFVEDIQEITVGAKRFDPGLILNKAIQNIPSNIYDSLYQTEMFNRGFISIDNAFVLYRQTDFSIAAHSDEIFYDGIRGEILNDGILLNKHVKSLYNNKFNGLIRLLPSTSRTEMTRNNDRLNGLVVKIEVIIRDKDSKIYVIDVYNDDANPEDIDAIYEILDKSYSPYQMLFDTCLQSLGERLITNHSVRFNRYYIDGNNNFNIVKLLKLEGYIFGTFWFESIEYTNEHKQSVPVHATVFKEFLVGKDKGRNIYAKSMAETFCFNRNFSDSINSYSNQDDIAMQHGGVYWPIINWGRDDIVGPPQLDGNYVKSDSLLHRALEDIEYYKTNPFPVKLEKLEKTSLLSYLLNNSNDVSKVVRRLTISGIVTDAESDEPLEFCNVMAKNLDDTLAKPLGAITNQDGYFMIDLPPLINSYEFTFSYIGYKPYSTIAKKEDLFDGLPFGALSSENNLVFEGGLDIDIELVKDQNLLQEAEVTASAYRMDIDKQEVIITKDMMENTIAAKDVLNKVNGLSYDRIGKVLKVDGDKNVKVLVDGMDKKSDYILNLNPKRIMKVEVLRNISGIYEIQGYTSIINIITYDNYRGADLLISDSDFRNSKKGQRASRHQNNAGISLEMMRNKWNFLLETDAYSEDLSTYLKTETDYLRSQEKLVSSHGDGPNFKEKSLAPSFKLGVDYRPHRKHIIGIEASGSVFPEKYDSDNYSLDSLISGNQAEAVENRMIDKYEDQNLEGKLFYRYEKNKHTHFTAYANYSHTESNHHQCLVGVQSYKENIQSDEIKSYAEFETRFGKLFDISTGAVYSQNEDENRYVEGSGSSFSSQYEKATGFAFGNIKLGKKDKLRVGSAFTYYQLGNDQTDYDFKSFEPQVHYSHIVSEKSKWEFDYRVNTHYPGIYALSPLTSLITPYASFTGNPDLKPYNYHKIEVSYKWLKQDMLRYLTVKPYFKFSDNAPGYVVQITDSFLSYSHDNFVKHEMLGLQTNVAFRLHKKLELDCDLNLYNERMTNLTVDPVFDWTGSAQLTFKLTPKQFFAMIYNKDNAKLISSLGYDKFGSQYLVVYWRGMFAKGKLEITMGYSLPLNPDMQNESYENTVAYKRHSYIDNSFMQNMLYINLSYRFSKGKVKYSNTLNDEDKSIKERGIMKKR